MYQIKIFILLVFVLFLVSCEEVIDLNLDTRSATLVIESVLTDADQPFEVRLSQSINFDQTNNFPGVSGAEISITDDFGNLATLTEEEIGLYRTAANLKGIPGSTYHLKVVAKGKVYTAQSLMPASKVFIDSLSFAFEEKSIFQDEGYYASCHFNDPANVLNYYRIKVLVNGAPYVFDFDGTFVKDDNLRITTDKFTDGSNRKFTFGNITLEIGDEVSVELDNLDKVSYDYYNSLIDVIDGNGVAPANPVTNITGGAFGYFGAVSISNKTITIQ